MNPSFCVLFVMTEAACCDQVNKDKCTKECCELNELSLLTDQNVKFIRQHSISLGSNT